MQVLYVAMECIWEWEGGCCAASRVLKSDEEEEEYGEILFSDNRNLGSLPQIHSWTMYVHAKKLLCCTHAGPSLHDQFSMIIDTQHEGGIGNVLYRNTKSRDTLRVIISEGKNCLVGKKGSCLTCFLPPSKPPQAGNQRICCWTGNNSSVARLKCCLWTKPEI